MPTKRKAATRVPILDTDAILVARCDGKRQVVTRRTADPWASMWRELRLFANVEIAQQSLKYTKDAKPSVAASLSNSIRLADAYFSAYMDSDEIIDPTILYYGAMWLSAAVIHANVPPGRFGWAHAHGLKPSGNPTPRFLEQRWKTERGTATMLVKALGSADLESNPLDVTLEALLRAVPELDGILADATGTGCNAIQVTPFTLDPRDRILRVYAGRPEIVTAVWLSDDACDADFPAREIGVYRCLIERQLGHMPPRPQLVWRHPWSTDHDLKALCIDAGGKYFLERRFAGGQYVPEIALHLIILCSLSFLARYRADDWMRMHDKYSKEYGLFREFIALTERKFPNLVLNELSHRHYDFGT